MGNNKKPGVHGHGHRPRLRDGTLSLQPSPTPTSAGIVGPPAPGTTEGWFSTTGSSQFDWIAAAGRLVPGGAKSLLLKVTEWSMFQGIAPVSAEMLRHYVEGSGEPYVLVEVPESWQVWIAKHTGGRAGHHDDVNPYNSGLMDLRNSFGHFQVDITANSDGTKTYVMSDVYEFTYIRKDRQQRGRHGFPLGNMTETKMSMVRSLLPTAEHWNPGGFKERWEIKRIGKETFLMVPQEVLAQNGKPFKSGGSFRR